MSKVTYTIMIPNDMDIDSVVINLEHKAKTSERHRQSKDRKRGSNIPFRNEKTEEPDDGLLYDELC